MVKLKYECPSCHTLYQEQEKAFECSRGHTLDEIETKDDDYEDTDEGSNDDIEAKMKLF